MIGIIDYSMGNLHSVLKAFEHVGADVEIITSAAQIDAADKIVLPGVGAFQDAIRTLHEKELATAIVESVRSGKWFLGICLGLQLLFDVSYEDGEHQGLGIIPGKVKRFDFSTHSNKDNLKIPHIGWNSLKVRNDCPLCRGVAGGSFVYFVHSYYVVPDDSSVIATTTEHGIEFVSSIRRGNLFATQFHPEKSQQVGLQMIANFAAL